MKEMTSGANLVTWLLIGHVTGMMVRIRGMVPKQLRGSDMFRLVTCYDSASTFGLPLSKSQVVEDPVKFGEKAAKWPLRSLDETTKWGGGLWLEKSSIIGGCSIATFDIKRSIFGGYLVV